MIDNGTAFKKAWSHTTSRSCPKCVGDEQHIFVVFHITKAYIWQCTSCGSQFNEKKEDGQVRLEFVKEPKNKFFPTYQSPRKFVAGELVKYMAEFDLDYVHDDLAKSFIRHAKEIKNGE